MAQKSRQTLLSVLCDSGIYINICKFVNIVQSANICEKTYYYDNSKDEFLNMWHKTITNIHQFMNWLLGGLIKVLIIELSITTFRNLKFHWLIQGSNRLCRSLVKFILNNIKKDWKSRCTKRGLELLNLNPLSFHVTVIAIFYAAVIK